MRPASSDTIIDLGIEDEDDAFEVVILRATTYERTLRAIVYIDGVRYLPSPQEKDQSL